MQQLHIYMKKEEILVIHLKVFASEINKHKDQLLT